MLPVSVPFCRYLLVLWMMLYSVRAATAQLPPGVTAPRTTQTVAPRVASNVPDAAPASSQGVQSPYYGSISGGSVQPGELSLTLSDAITRGLRFNLGLIYGRQDTEIAQASSQRALSALLPNVTASLTQSVQQVNLAAFGLPPLPGIPAIVGPFQLVDARAFLTTPVFDLVALENRRAQKSSERAAQLTYQDARDLVVQAVTGLYLQTVSGAARIDTARAQLNTAEALYRQAADLKNAGVAAGIDVIRADVERQTQQQRFIFVQNEWEKEKLRLARGIGLPLEQRFQLADRLPYTPPPPMTPEQALAESYKSRSDYQSAQAAIRAAEQAKRAAAAQRYPSLGINADYGALGPRVNNAHGTFTAAVGMRFSIFEGGRIEADVAQADALLERQRAEAEDLRGRIGFEVRTALLDINAAGEQVKVAELAVDLANQQITQARDRFAAGVANSLEVVQSQEAVAVASENQITALQSYNSAKASLARALGAAEDRTKQFLGVR